MGNIPFINTEDELATQYLQATSRMNPMLMALVTRDSLTRWYNYALDPARAHQDDGNASARIKFINDYLARADQGTPGLYKEEAFPLSDGVINFEKVLYDMILTFAVHPFP